MVTSGINVPPEKFGKNNTLIIFYKERLKILYSQGILNFD